MKVPHDFFLNFHLCLIVGSAQLNGEGSKGTADEMLVSHIFLIVDLGSIRPFPKR